MAWVPLQNWWPDLWWPSELFFGAWWVPAGHAISHNTPVPAVDCGGHFAEICAVCEQGRGPSWCNGECLWTFGHCQHLGGWTLLRHDLQDLLWVWVNWLPVLLLTCGVMLGYAYIYKSKVVEEYPRRGAGVIEERSVLEREAYREPRFGLFAIFSEPATALWAFFCTPVLAAKNYQVGEVSDFWTSCMILGCALYSPCCCFAAIFHAISSGKLKRNLRLRSSFVNDCILGLCCLPCEVGRESLEVDTEEYVEVRCPFQVKDVWEEPRKRPHHRMEESCLGARTSYTRGSEEYDEGSSWLGSCTAGRNRELEDPEDIDDELETHGQTSHGWWRSSRS